MATRIIHPSKPTLFDTSAKILVKPVFFFGQEGKFLSVFFWPKSKWINEEKTEYVESFLFLILSDEWDFYYVFLRVFKNLLWSARNIVSMYFGYDMWFYNSLFSGLAEVYSSFMGPSITPGWSDRRIHNRWICNCLVYENL